MQAMQTYTSAQTADLRSPDRNKYFFGKMLDVVHFDIEQDYFNYKRSLINRLVIGYGVVCGLNVILRNGGVVVTPGFAIDRWGREIIVPGETKPFDLPTPPPPKEQQPESGDCAENDHWYHLLLCYHECGSSPEPVLGGECGVETCVPSLVQERFKLDWRKGRAPEPPHEDCLSELITGDRINRRAIAQHVTQCCSRTPCDPCIELANLRLPRQPEGGNTDIDISVRPIVYTNDLLFEMLSALISGRQNYGRAGK
jgi:hypothetical protein